MQIDEDRRGAAGGEAAEEVEIRGLLQRALEPLGDLIERVLGRRARPNRLNHHRLDDETRILVPAEPEIGQDSRRHSDDHEIGDERPMIEGPLGKVKRLHESSPSIRTF